MKRLLLPVFSALFTLIFISVKGREDKQMSLWYKQPARVWNEALPIGNGRLAAMAFGDPVNEKLQLNESTFWSGGPSRNDNPAGPQVLDSIRYYLFNGNYKRAEVLANQGLTAIKLHGAMFQPVGNLHLAFNGMDNYSKYERRLDLENAVFTTSFQADGVLFKREVFASQCDDLLVIHLTASKHGRLSFTMTLDGALQQATHAVDAQTLEMTSLSSTHEGIEGQVRAYTRAKVIPQGGSTRAVQNGIRVEAADEVVILLSMATNFIDYKTLGADAGKKCRAYIDAVRNRSYAALLKEHTDAYQRYFNRVAIQLGTSEAMKLPTDERLKQFAHTEDPALVALFYQFGRYLLISSSRPGGQPANLQGIWNAGTHPAWDSKYTININTEMNYWPAEKCNLEEMHEPLIQLVRELSASGKQTARSMYHADGWVTHHNTDLWRISGVVDFANAGQWPMGGAWLSQHLWEKYLYSGNLDYLQSVYPILKSACVFYQDFLIEEPTHHWLVVSPSVSPENIPQGHQGSALSAGTTMDNQLLFDLFTKTIRAAMLLKKDAILMEDFQKILDRLPPMQIGRYGQLQEWIGDWDNPEDKHRHVSHLYGLFPSDQISPYSSPELFDAARTVLIHRGDVSTGWSMGWKINLWAQLLDGNHAAKLIHDQLTWVDPMKPGNNGGTYPNLLDAHPPFQIDGNFGCTSGITEMLVQTRRGAIDILPALPDTWKDGSITGIRTYGGFQVDVVWKYNRVEKLVVKSVLGGNCRLRLPNQITLANGSGLLAASGQNENPFFEVASIKEPLISLQAKLHAVQLKQTYCYDLSTESGQTYTLVMKK